MFSEEVVGLKDFRLVFYKPFGGRLGVVKNFISLEYADALNDLPTLKVVMPRSVRPAVVPCEVGLEVRGELKSGGVSGWVEPEDCRFIATNLKTDPASPADTYTLSCLGVGQALRWATVWEPTKGNPDFKRVYPARTPGFILDELLSGAKDRADEGLKWANGQITWRFNASVDSGGVAWGRNADPSFAPSASLEKVIGWFASKGAVDWRFSGRELQVYRSGGLLSRDRSQVRLSSKTATAMPVTESFEKLTTVARFHGDGGFVKTKIGRDASRLLGRVERWSEQGQVSRDATAELYLDQLLAGGRVPAKQWRREWALPAVGLPGRGTPVLWVSYRLGDWVSLTDLGEPVRVVESGFRVKSNGEVTGWDTLGTRLESLLEKLARHTTDLSTGMVGSDSGKPSSGVVKEITESLLPPPVPSGLVGTSTVTVRQDGSYVAVVSAAWNSVNSENTDSNAGGKRYEVWWRPVGRSWWTFGCATDGVTGEFYADPDTKIEVVTRSVSDKGVYSPYSVPVVVDTGRDTVPPPKPSAPTVTVTPGLLRVAWDGHVDLDTGGDSLSPGDVTHVDVAISGEADPADGDDTGAVSRFGVWFKSGNDWLFPLPADKTVRVRIRLVDRAGNAGPWTAWARPVTGLGLRDDPAYKGLLADFDKAQQSAEAKLAGLEADLAALPGKVKFDPSMIPAGSITGDMLAGGKPVGYKETTRTVTSEKWLPAGDDNEHSLEHLIGDADGIIADLAGLRVLHAKNRFPVGGAARLKILIERGPGEAVNRGEKTFCYIHWYNRNHPCADTVELSPQWDEKDNLFDRFEGEVEIPAKATHAEVELYAQFLPSFTYSFELVDREPIIPPPAVTADKLAPGSVGTVTLAPGAVTGSVLADGAVTVGKIADNSIPTGKLVDAAVTGVKLADNAVGESKLVAGAVTAGKLAAGAVVADKIAANAVTAGKLAAGAVTANSVAAGAITSDKLAANSVTAGKLAAGAVTAGSIAAGAITSDKIAAGAITADKITAGTGGFNEAVINSLFANSTFTKKLQANQVTVSGDNLIPDPEFTQPTRWADINTQAHPEFTDGWVILKAATSNSNRRAGIATLLDHSPMVDGGMPYTLSIGYQIPSGSTMRVKSFSIAANWYDRNKKFLSAVGSTTPQPGDVTPGAWERLTFTTTAPPTAKYCKFWVSVYFLPAGTSTLEYIWLREPRMVSAVDASVIVDGSITGNKIKAGTVEAGHIKAGAITAEKLSADAIDGKTITGAILQSSYALDGWKLDGNFKTLELYDSDGVLRFMQDADHSSWESKTQGNYIQIGTSDYRGRAMITLSSKSSSVASGYELPANIFVTSKDEQGQSDAYLYPALVVSGPEKTANSSGRAEVTLGEETRWSIGTVWGAPECAVVKYPYKGAAIEYVSSHGHYFYNSSDSDWAHNVFSLVDIPHTTLPMQTLGMIVPSSLPPGHSWKSEWQVYYGTSKRDSKLLIRDLEVEPERLLNVPIRDWYDRTFCEQRTAARSSRAEYVDAGLEVPPEMEAACRLPLNRVPGLVAEEVEAAGLEEFVQYSRDGAVAGVAYDRLWILLIPIVKELRERLATVEAKLAQLSDSTTSIEAKQ